MKYLSLITLLVTTLSLLNAQTIYEIQGQTDISPYNGQTVTTKGIVTAVYSASYFIQDGDDEWTGLYIYDATQHPNLGDSIQLTGTIVEYYNMTELKDITAYTVISSGNILPEPIPIKTGEAGEKWESVFIQIENATCTKIDLGYGEWEVNDGSGALVVNDLGLAYRPILGVNYAIKGPLDYSFLFYKIEPRTLDDIVQDLALFFTVNPYAEHITKTGFDIKWETNDLASAYIEYGLTTDYDLGKAFSTVSSTVHSISIENLTAGNVYYAKQYSINANHDTTPLNHSVYATQSESSGKINTYFNSIEPQFSNGENATKNMVDTIIMYIEKAKTSLDITLYDLTNHAPQSDSSNYKIIQAINNVYENGVKVRFITDDSPINAALDSLNPLINLVRGNAGGIMHNKFLIIDAENVDDTWVITGSTNWTYNNLFMDFNNLVCIQDQSLAKAYLIEFNEMWGSSDLTPDSEKAKFGNQKTDNTPHYFNINGVAVELYFSPSDNTTSKIVKAIDNAENSVDFAMMAFTEDKLGNAIVSANVRGISTTGIIDYIEYSGSEYDYLLNNGVEVYDYANLDGSSWPDGTTLHHKYCIIDKNGQNPLVITGTHNWTASAESKNDENTLLIYDKTQADIYYGEFENILNRLINVVNEKAYAFDFNVYPNPSPGNFTISFGNDGHYTISIFDVLGQQMDTFNANPYENNISINRKGLFIIQVSNGINTRTKPLIVQ